MIDKARMETQAIKDTRRFCAEMLTEMELLAPFHDRTTAGITAGVPTPHTRRAIG
jgi:hypothetical protein